MSTVVDLSEQELAELKELTKQSDAGAAIRVAMSEYLRYVRRMRLKEQSGKMRMDDNWQELERAELEGSNGSPGAGAD